MSRTSNTFVAKFSILATRFTTTVLTFVTLTTSEGVYGQPASTRQPATRLASVIVGGEYGLKQTRLKLSNSEVDAQGARSSVSFPKALRKAVECALTDASQPSSPLAQTLFLLAADPEQPDVVSVSRAQYQEASIVLQSYLNSSRSSMRLLTRNERAARGETSNVNWIFEIRIPDLSDQPYYVVVDRRGSRATYTYGG